MLLPSLVMTRGWLPLFPRRHATQTPAAKPGPLMGREHLLIGGLMLPMPALPDLEHEHVAAGENAKGPFDMPLEIKLHAAGCPEPLEPFRRDEIRDQHAVDLIAERVCLDRIA